MSCCSSATNALRHGRRLPPRPERLVPRVVLQSERMIRERLDPLASSRAGHRSSTPAFRHVRMFPLRQTHLLAGDARLPRMSDLRYDGTAQPSPPRLHASSAGPETPYPPARVFRTSVDGLSSTGKGRIDPVDGVSSTGESSVGRSDVSRTGVLLVPCPVTSRMLATALKGRSVTEVGCRARSCAAARAAARLSSQQGTAAPPLTAAARGRLTLVAEPSSGDSL